PGEPPGHALRGDAFPVQGGLPRATPGPPRGADPDGGGGQLRRAGRSGGPRSELAPRGGNGVVVAPADGAAQDVEALPHHQHRIHLDRRPRGSGPPARSTRRVSGAKHILVLMCTRPEAIKLAPVVAALRRTDGFRCTVVATGQHKEMFWQVTRTFGFDVDADLEVMEPDQTLAGL